MKYTYTKETPTPARVGVPVGVGCAFHATSTREGGEEPAECVEGSEDLLDGCCRSLRLREQLEDAEADDEHQQNGLDPLAHVHSSSGRDMPSPNWPV